MLGGEKENEDVARRKPGCARLTTEGRNRKETSEEAALAEHFRPITLLLPLFFYPSSVLAFPSLSPYRL